MSVTMLVGLGVVVVSAMIAFPMLFGKRPEPATVPADPRRAPRARSQRNERRVRSDERFRYDVNLRWWQRIRSGFGLVIVTAALGAAVAVVLGLAVLGLGLSLQGR
ncbi:MAG TPA: hypothetical protein VJM33_02950 [Microthrixaceae bacterium]|nr:hypothetical protein [Microthrixaceae bacterium]